MGATIVEIGATDPAQVARAQGLLAPVGSVEVDGYIVKVNINEGARGVLDVARILEQNELVPDSFTVREPTLDDVFLSLTGHRAEPVRRARRRRHSPTATRPTDDHDRSMAEEVAR